MQHLCSGKVQSKTKENLWWYLLEVRCNSWIIIWILDDTIIKCVIQKTVMVLEYEDLSSNLTLPWSNHMILVESPFLFGVCFHWLYMHTYGRFMFLQQKLTHHCKEIILQLKIKKKKKKTRKLPCVQPNSFKV